MNNAFDLVSNVDFKGKYIIKCCLELITGLHIGKGQNSLEIGGVDNSVIKDAFGRPYIPGSSLKGKMRSLMEFSEGKIKAEDLIITVGNRSKTDRKRMHMCGDLECAVCNIFGRNHGEHNTESGPEPKKSFDNAVIPTRLIVRDAYLDVESITDEMKENIDLEWTEVKFENNLDRITSMANPRQNERVPAGARFNCEFVLNVFDEDNDKYLKKFLKAMQLLEDDYLGGQGTRGYGKVVFNDITITFRSKDYYASEQAINEEIICDKAKALADAISRLDNFNS